MPPPDPDDAQRLERLEQQLAEVAELYGVLAHEIKNPLSVIRLNVDLLAEDFTAPQSPQERRVLQKIRTLQAQCERLQTLLDDFLKFTRVRRLYLVPGSLNRVVQRVLDFFEPAAVQQGVEVIRYLDPDLPTIHLDAQMLYVAVLNLVKNGLEAMPHGGQLVARTRATRAGVALDLIDTGCGMDEITATHMFEAFFSTKPSGTGLGLPTTRRIVDAHGGAIDVQSEVGRGTQFTLSFPTPPRIGEEASGKGGAES